MKYSSARNFKNGNFFMVHQVSKIVRLSPENGAMYKEIVLTSQDPTGIIGRVLPVKILPSGQDRIKLPTIIAREFHEI